MHRLALTLVVVLVACGGKSKPATAPGSDPVVADPVVADPVVADPAPTAPTPTDAELEVLFARSFDFFEEFAGVIEASAANCATLATELERVLTKNAAVLAEVKHYKGNAEVDAKADAYMALHHDRLERVTKRMAGIRACKDDAAVQAVMDRFDE